MDDLIFEELVQREIDLRFTARAKDVGEVWGQTALISPEQVADLRATEEESDVE